MKKSQKISVWSSIVLVVLVILSIALYNPLEHITIGAVPVMLYGMIILGIASIIATYILIAKIEKLEEKGE